MADLESSRRYMLALVVVFLLLNCFAESLVLEEEFRGKLVTEVKLDLPADEVWAVYRSPEFYKILYNTLIIYYDAIDYVSGTGRVGSIVNMTIKPAFGGSNWVFQVVEINDKTKTRVERHVKGEHFDSGFTSFETSYTVIKRKTNSCFIRETSSFTMQPKSVSNASSVELNWATSGAVSVFVNNNRKTYVDLNEEYSANVVTEMKVNLPAKDIWDVFRSKNFGHLIRKLRRNYFKEIDYVTGDGGVGTVLNVTLQPEFGSLNWLDKIIEIADETMTTRLRQVQGYYLDSGFTLFETVYRTIPKAGNSCAIRAVTALKVDSWHYSEAPRMLPPSWATASTIADYVNSKITNGQKKIADYFNPKNMKGEDRI